MPLVHGSSAQATPDPVMRRLRLVHRVASELRRGIPVVLNGTPPLVILAAETAGPHGIGELAALGTEAPVLLLAPVRAAAVLRQPVPQEAAAVAVRLPDALLNAPIVQALADATARQAIPRQGLDAAPTPALASAALGLAKLGRLLPAVLAVPGDAARIDAAIRAGTLLAIDPEAVLSYPAAEVAGLRQIASAPVPLTAAPDAIVVAFRTEGSSIEHLAIVIGDPRAAEAPLVRIHSECFTGDLLGSMRCDCGEQLRGAIARMAEDGAGVLLYLAQEGRGIGLVNKLRAYTLQDRGFDTLDANRVLGWGADERNFLIGATMLVSLGIRRIRLLTNNPEKVAAMVACGVEIVGREAHAFAPNGVNDEYLATKAARFGHMLD
jgi:GTP cyclohydrolase II